MECLPRHVQKPDPSRYLSENYVVVDFETTTLDFGNPHNEKNSMLCASWRTGRDHPNYSKETKRIKGDELHMEALLQDIEAADFFIAHQTKFELGWLYRCGLDIATVLPYCTRLGEICIAGNRRWDLSLKGCLKRRKMRGKDPIGDLIRWGVDTLSIPPSWLGKYCDRDVEVTEKLFHDQRRTLYYEGLLPTAYTRNLLTPVLFDIERQGLHLDVERTDAVYNWHINKKAELETRWNELTGGVNIGSPKQKRRLLYEDMGIPLPINDQGKPIETDTGQPSTNAAALKALVLRTKEQKEVVSLLQELTSISQALSKTIKKLYEAAHNEGYITADFLQFSAGTHRLASRGRNYAIQLQNFPNAFRPLIRPRFDGWFMGDGDSAGIEFRTAVDLAKDDTGLADIENDVDIHSFTASVIFADKWDPEANPKTGTNATYRKKAKAFTFKPLYGGSSGTDDQRAYFAAFRERYHQIADMQQGWAEEVLRTKKLLTQTGLKFYWPDCKLSHDGRYIKYTTQIYDYPVQSLATAEMCPTATVYLWHMMRVARMASFLVNLVHDSAVGEIHPDEREQWSEYMQYCFNKLIVWYLAEVYDYSWTTPLASEVNIFTHWDDRTPEEWLAQWKPREETKHV